MHSDPLNFKSVRCLAYRLLKKSRIEENTGMTVSAYGSYVSMMFSGVQNILQVVKMLANRARLLAKFA
jgi:hypothetical protein